MSEIIKSDFCLECHKSFNEVERFEDTNLCVNCFYKDIQPVSDTKQDRKQKEAIVSPDDAVFIGKAHNIAEAIFIRMILQENNIQLLYIPGSSRVLYGIGDNLNIAVKKKDKDRAIEILQENGINVKDLDPNTPFTAAKYFSIFQNNNNLIYYYFIVAWLLFIIGIILNIIL